MLPSNGSLVEELTAINSEAKLGGKSGGEKYEIGICGLHDGADFTGDAATEHGIDLAVPIVGWVTLERRNGSSHTTSSGHRVDVSAIRVHGKDAGDR
jgi:hypothetical protein